MGHTNYGQFLPQVAIIFYSTWGHCKTLAESILEGVKEAGGEGHLLQIQETLPSEVLTKMHAPPHPFPDIPVAVPEDLASADGVLFGIPTRFGRANAQISAFFDATGGLWAKVSVSVSHEKVDAQKKDQTLILMLGYLSLFP